MISILAHSNNTSMPVWVTINEAIAIINHQVNITVAESDIWRHILYRHLTLSVYFQSPVKFCRICMDKGNMVLKEVDGNIINKICQLSGKCLLNNDGRYVKTEGDYISPSCQILDVTLLGQEYTVVQKQLARTLSIPEPVTGQHNMHCGILVRENGVIYQITELTTWRKRISRQLKNIPTDAATCFRKQIPRNIISAKRGEHYFPAYNLPEDACFVLKYENLARFICDYLATNLPADKKNRISTPMSRLLWLACKHNDSISPLMEHPYKLLSVFEQWAATEGIPTPLSSETLKTALARGAPVSTSHIS